MEERVELYKIRTMGERFSATSDFVRENWKVLAKNILPVGLFLSLVVGFFMQHYMQNAFALIENPMALDFINWWAFGGMMITSILFSLFIYAMTGAILYKHADRSLNPETGWEDLKGSFFPNAGKIFIQMCIIGLVALVSAIIIGFFFGALTIVQESGLVAVIAVFLLIMVLAVLLIALIPGLSLIYYPVFMEQASARKGIAKGFKWGFRYWGSTFLSVLLGALILAVVVYILSMPYTIYIIFTMGSGSWIVSYLLSALIFIATLLIQPIYIIFIAFQYTSIATKEEEKSLAE